MRRFSFFLFIFVFCNSAVSQWLDGGQDPPDINWQTLKTTHFEIIYPSELHEQARYVANICEHVLHPVLKTMTAYVPRVPLILSNRQAISNGYVTLAPRRSEWYHTPFQTGSDDGGWYELLATHELRHVAQFDKLRQRGLYKVWNILGGQAAVSSVSYFLIPRWFWEGDAVLTETLLSDGGRGRKADFDLRIRTFEQAGKHFSYYKSMLGSYKDPTPDPYALGYLLTTYVRRTAYPAIWNDVLGRSSWFSIFPFAFSAALRGLYGKNVAATYELAMQNYRAQWQKARDSISVSPAIDITPRIKPDTYTNYLYPQSRDGKTIYALKSGMSDVSQLVRIQTDEGLEEKLLEASPGGSFHLGPESLVWDRYRAHWRWGKQNYSDIVQFSLKSGDRRALNSAHHLYSPVFSPDGKTLAAVEFLAEFKSRILLLDAGSGAIRDTLPNPENLILKTPSWSEDGKEIVFTGQSAGGKGIYVYNLEKGKINTVVEHTWLGITRPVLWRHFVLFHSGLSGIDNIYAIDRRSGQPYQVTSRPFGAFNPALVYGQDVLLFNDYTADGYRIAKMELDTLRFVPVEQVRDLRLKFEEKLVDEEADGSIIRLGEIPNYTWPSKPYSRWRHLLNIHSWQPVPDSLNLGFYVQSTDVLNTLSVGAGLFFNRTEGKPGGMLQLSYGGWYALIDVAAQKWQRARSYNLSNGTKFTDYWTENTLLAGLRLPLNFSAGSVGHAASLAVYARFSEIEGRRVDLQNGINNGTLKSLMWQASWARTRRSAPRDVRPQWGQALLALAEHDAFNSAYSAKHFYLRGRSYWPGILRHHSLMMSGQYEVHQTGNYRFASYLQNARGYGYHFNDTALVGSVDYALPLFYPDWNLSAWFYLKRIKANLFYDLEMAGNKFSEHRQSAGFEVLFDHHWFSTPVELEGGYQLALPFDSKKPQHAFILRLPLY